MARIRKPALQSRQLLLPGMEPLLELPQKGSGFAGIDEAGRGCLAGPVVACACILPEDFELAGLTDSKKLDAAHREAYAPYVRERCIAWGIGVVWPRRIDEINILQATYEAMSRAAASLGHGAGENTPAGLLSALPGELLIDGNHTIPKEVLLREIRRLRPSSAIPRQRCIVKGDSRVLAISAASVLAKTWRDALMRHLARRYPGYGFEVHKGYGTKLHCEALERLGASHMHRLTFGKVPGRMA